MDLGRFLPGLRSWTLREIGCAAGLLAVSAGAGYCVYRYLQGQSAAADHTQPAHDSVDVLGGSLHTPSVLQVVEPEVQLLQTEPQVDTSAVSLPPSTGELNRAWCDAQVQSPDCISSQSESVDIKRDTEPDVDTSAVSLPPSTGELNRAWCDAQVQSPDCISSQSESVDIKRATEPHHDTSAVSLPPSTGELNRAWCDAQVQSPDCISSQSESVDIKRATEPHHDTSAVSLPPSTGELNRAWCDAQVQSPDCISSQSESVDIKRATEPHHDTSAVSLPPSAGELNRASCIVQVQSPESFSSQSEPVNITRDILRILRGPESRLCETRVLYLLNHEEFSYDTEDWFTGIQVVEANLQLQPTEPQVDTSAVSLPPSTGELNRAWSDAQVQSPDCISSQSEGFSHFKHTEDHLTGPQVVEPYDELLPTASHDDLSAFVLPLTAGILDHAWKNVQFLSADCFSSQSRSVENKTCYCWMIRGPESVFCWFNTTKTCYLNHMGIPYVTHIEDSFTGIKSISGRVTEYLCCNHMESSVLVALEDYGHIFKKVTCTYLHVLEDGQVDTATWETKEVCSPHSSQSNSEDCEEGFSPEEVEVPFISRHLSDREVTDMGLKLPALRQAFDAMVGCMLNLNFLFLTGKKIVMQLAAANNQDAVHVRLAYEALIRFLRTSSNQESIAAELSGAGLHFNFLDVFYELLIIGYYGNGFVPETFEGGFLQRLMALVSMWDLDVWEPAAELYFTVLIDQLTELLEVLFSQPLELYKDPEALATAATRLIKQHVQLMMNTLEKL
ncbi:uncharacterized protein LOC131361977 [Hemibagrus wyckioides]|uniref:uncharacterized protein LOC131361977 n=1 Tax=Hemibagrus wyckioides TaxID=337641 RepID=UPI00266D8595|nr:uncharacterized protein LOC131361977 [Hemibagrus wyckioides]